MTEPVEVVDSSDYIPQPAPPKALRETVEKMVKVVAFGPGFESAEQIDAEVEAPSIRSAFDRGANLVMPEPEPPIVPSAATRPPRPTRRDTPRSGGRPAGADELTGLFATGFITLVTFAIGEWALPTAEEANELARPLANILARRIDIAARLGRDANDTIAFAIAVMAYLVRVGPIGAERFREWNSEREAQSRRDRVDRATERSNYPSRESSLDDGSSAGTGSDDNSAYRPFDALAKARRIGLDSLDRDFGYAPTDAPTVGD